MITILMNISILLPAVGRRRWGTNGRRYIYKQNNNNNNNNNNKNKNNENEY